MDEKSIEAAIDAGLDVWRCGKSIDDGIRAAIAAYRDAEAKRSDRCEHCGSIVISYRSGCPGCGAPQCCQRCCDKAEIERLNENIKTLLANHQTVRAKLEAAELDARRECLWVNDDDYEVWEGSCGVAWTFIDAGPAENGMKHCPQCGGHLTLDDAARGGERG